MCDTSFSHLLRTNEICDSCRIHTIQKKLLIDDKEKWVCLECLNEVNNERLCKKDD